MNRLTVRLGALAAAAAMTATAVPAFAMESGPGGLATVATHACPGESYAQYYRYRGRYGYYRHRGYGGAAAAGVAGLAAGALIGGAIASSQAAPAYPGARSATFTDATRTG